MRFGHLQRHMSPPRFRRVRGKGSVKHHFDCGTTSFRDTFHGHRSPAILYRDEPPHPRLIRSVFRRYNYERHFTSSWGPFCVFILFILFFSKAKAIRYSCLRLKAFSAQSHAFRMAGLSHRAGTPKLSFDGVQTFRVLRLRQCGRGPLPKRR